MNIVDRILKKLGFEKTKTVEEIRDQYNLEYKDDIQKAYNIVYQHSMLSYLKLANLYEQVVYCTKNNISGDFVECGVWKGGAVGMMALALLNQNQDQRKIHLFDAFDDICEPDPSVDGQQAMEDIENLLGTKPDTYTGALKTIPGIYDSRGGHGTIAECKALVADKIGYPKELLLFHKGWFQDTLPKTVKTIEKIAILRLDGDWYSSTKVCLEYLYPKVIAGGFIIIDDYGRYDGCKKAVDEYLAKNKIKVFLNYSDFKGGECRYFIKPE